MKQHIHLIRTIALYVVIALLGIYTYTHWDIVNQALDIIADAPPSYLIFSILLVTATFGFAAISYYSLAIKKVRIRELLIVELAAAAATRALPAGIGGMGAHALYLRRRLHTKTQSATIVSSNNVLGFIVHILLFALFLSISHVDVPKLYKPEASPIMLIVIAGALAIAIVVMWGTSAMHSIRKGLADTASLYVRKPYKVFVATLALMGITLLNFAVFMLALRAIGIDLSAAEAFVVYSAGVLVGSATPTPGGLAGVEAGLVGGMTAFGIDQGLAVAGTLAFRFVTFWLPIVPGIIALQVAKQKKLI